MKINNVTMQMLGKYEIKNIVDEIDFEESKEDVIPFIKDISSLNIWSKDFFISITDKLF